MEDICLDNIIIIAPIIIAKRKLNFMEKVWAVFRFSGLRAPYATPAVVKTAVPIPVNGIIAICTILIDAVYTATPLVSETKKSK